jgi:hypothetical protein
MLSALAKMGAGNGPSTSPTEAVIVAKPVVETVTVVDSEDEPHALAATAPRQARTAAPL